MPDLGNIASNIINTAHDQLNAALFQVALANLNWSRGYSWFVELDGAPSPFQRGGVLGLPVTNVQYTLVTGEEIDWESGGQKFFAPKGRSGDELVTLDLIDDEQQTMFTFFERWYNNVYNPYKGTLPLNEACKEITIYKLKSTRNKINRNIKRGNVDYSEGGSNVFKKVGNLIKAGVTKDVYNNTVTGRTFYVYPYGSFQQTLDNKNEPMSFNVTLRIAYQADADYGIPSSIYNKSLTDVAGSFLEKAANYI